MTMCHSLQRNFDVIQYLVKDALPEQLTWRQSEGGKSLAEVLCRLRDTEMWNAGVRIVNGNTPATDLTDFDHNCAAANEEQAFEAYVYYRQKTLALLRDIGSTRQQYRAVHKLFGEVNLAELVDLIDKYDQIHIHQLEEVIHNMPLNPLYRRALAEISDYHRRYQSHLVQAASLLDIGVGTGLALQHVMRHNPHLTCTGVDVRDLRLSQVSVSLQVYDGYTLPFPAGHFDVSLMFYVLHHCYNPQRLLDEAVRVTRQKLIIIEKFNLADADAASLDLTERQSHRALGIPPDLPYQLFDQPEFEQMLRVRNLVKVEQQVLPSKTTRPVQKYLYVTTLPVKSQPVAD